MQKEKDRYHNCGGKEKDAEYYLENRGVLKEKAKHNYRNLSEEEKEAKKEYGRHLKILVLTFLKHKCMHENCLLDKAVDLLTIC